MLRKKESSSQSSKDPERVDAPRTTDVFSVAKRSEVMSKVRSTRNKSTELRMIEEFKARRITGWRRNSKIFGHPDFVFPKLRVAVFVDGCFWHGHNCRNTTPKNHAGYWREKIERNRRRDLEATERLSKLGYRVIRVWECDFKKANVDKLEEKLAPLAAVARRAAELKSTTEERAKTKKVAE